MRIDDDTLYLGDNGRIYCGEHLGSSAKHSGRDISGKTIQPVTPEDAKYAADMGIPMECEDARCDRTPSLLHTAQS